MRCLCFKRPEKRCEGMVFNRFASMQYKVRKQLFTFSAMQPINQDTIYPYAQFAKQLYSECSSRSVLHSLTPLSAIHTVEIVFVSHSVSMVYCNYQIVYTVYSYLFVTV